MQEPDISATALLAASSSASCSPYISDDNAQQKHDTTANNRSACSLEGGVVGLDAPLGAGLPGEQPLPEQRAAQRAAAVDAGLHGVIYCPVAQRISVVYTIYTTNNVFIFCEVFHPTEWTSIIGSRALT